MKNYMPEIIKSMQEVIQIKTVLDTPVENGPFGKGNKECLEKVLALCESLGFRTKNLDGYCGYAEIGEGKELVGIIGHLDVVPEGDGWTYPPYSAKIVDDVMWGRGTWDDKGPTIISIYVIKALMDEGFKFNKRVRLIFGCNEESGSLCMEHYLKVEEPISYGVSPDSSFPVIFAEKTISNVRLSGKGNNNSADKLESLESGIVINAVPDVSKFVVSSSDINNLVNKLNKELEELKLKYTFEIANNKASYEVQGKAAHGSIPDMGLNAASYSILALSKVIDNDFTNFYSKVIGLDIHGESLGCYAIDQYGPIAVNVGLVRYNGVDFDVKINSRLPFSTNADLMNKQISETVSKYPYVKFEALGHSEGFKIDEDSIMIKSLSNAYYEVTGRYQDKPICTGGGTYAREFKNCVAFGPEMEGYGEITIHQPNEKISLKAIEDIFKIYYKAYQDLITKVSFND